MTHFFDAHTHVLDVVPEVTSVMVVDPSAQEIELQSSNNYAVAIHPWQSALASQEVFAKLDILAALDCVVAIGETGLDKHNQEVPIDVQLRVFAQHVQLSERVKKPLVIHCVRAFTELILLQDELDPKQHWIVHGYNRNVNIVRGLLDAGMIISVGAALLRNSQQLDDVVRYVPLQRLLIETDTTPSSQQRKVLEAVYQHVATLHNISVDELCLTQKQIFEAVFNRQQMPAGHPAPGS